MHTFSQQINNKDINSDISAGCVALFYRFMFTTSSIEWRKIASPLVLLLLLHSFASLAPLAYLFFKSKFVCAGAAAAAEVSTGS